MRRLFFKRFLFFFILLLLQPEMHSNETRVVSSSSSSSLLLFFNKAGNAFKWNVRRFFLKRSFFFCYPSLNCQSPPPIQVLVWTVNHSKPNPSLNCQTPPAKPNPSLNCQTPYQTKPSLNFEGPCLGNRVLLDQTGWCEALSFPFPYDELMWQQFHGVTRVP